MEFGRCWFVGLVNGEVCQGGGEGRGGGEFSVGMRFSLFALWRWGGWREVGKGMDGERVLAEST